MPKSYICDMDGVLVRGSQVVPGANEFIQRLQQAGARFLVLTNNSLYTPRDLHVRLRLMDMDGRNLTTLFELFGGQGTINVPCWSPEGDEFAYVRYFPAT